MTFRRIIPYLLTVILFSLIYWLTMLIPNKTLFLGWALESSEVIDNNKLPLHLYIFNYGLTLFLLTVNLLEIISTQRDRFWFRFIKSFTTIVLIYIVTYFISKQLDTKIWNMHYYHRGAPAFIWCIVTVTLFSIGLVILEGLKELYLLRFEKSFLIKFIPNWLKLEKARF